MRRGEVYWGNFDPTVGSEIQKTRPCLIVSNDIANLHSSVVTVLPLTSQKLDRIYPFEVAVLNNSKMKNSKIKANQIRTFDKARIGAKITDLSGSVMANVDKAILLHLGINLR
jgi:mRNA interferase MazF